MPEQATASLMHSGTSYRRSATAPDPVTEAGSAQATVRLCPSLRDPHAVLIVRTPLAETPRWSDYQRAARYAMRSVQLEVAATNVVLKPNLTVAERYKDPDSGITTHPGFVEGLVEYLYDHGAQRGTVSVLEDPRNSNDDTPRDWRGTGFHELAERTGIALHTPYSETCVDRPVPAPQARARIPVSDLAVSPGTVLINVPKLKTHNLAITTLCLKNLMGVVRAEERHFCAQARQEMPQATLAGKRPRNEWMDRALHERWQEGLARRLADLAQVVQPDLNVVEGIVGREGTGFERGRNRVLGLTVVGTNMVAVDSIASYLMGFDPAQLIVLQTAAQAGLGPADLSALGPFVIDGEEVVPCPDLEALRARPPLRVLTGIMGERADLFG